jgi:hypothetical protein
METVDTIGGIIMKKQIVNLISIIKGDANEACKLAREIANIPAVEIDSIQVWTAPVKEHTGECSYVEFMGIHAKFTWHDHTITIDETFNGKLIVKYDDNKIGEIFWSALWGKLESIPNYTELKITKAQSYILDCMWTCVHKISAKGRPYEKVALPKHVQYGDCRIWAECATIYAENNGEKIRVMGNTWRGLCWTADDVRLVEIQKVIKKAFVVY